MAWLFQNTTFIEKSKSFESNRVYLFPNVRYLNDTIDFCADGYEVFMREWQKLLMHNQEFSEDCQFFLKNNLVMSEKSYTFAACFRINE